MATSIEQLRIYTTARAAEDAVYELVKQFPTEQFYGLGNDLRRSSAGVSHYVMEAHRLYSYRLKLDALANARREAEATKLHLEAAEKLGATKELVEEYTSVIKQSWGLSKWLKAKLSERNEQAEVAAKEELVAAAA
jgi:four helix bundle protein